MIQPSLSPNETQRLRALRSLNVLETPLEDRFERITRIARRVLGTPIAAISLVDADRQWFKSIQGASMVETGRDISFCGHAILEVEPLIVSDARTDPRFSDNPLVLEAPHVVFYAGCPIQGGDGNNIATLCVVDHAPRQMSEEDLQLLRDLAAIAQTELTSAMQSGVQKELIDKLDEISRRAKIDGLTRVWNRDAIFNLLEKESADADPRERGVCVMMVDIDHFKRINDSHGHACGDDVLRQIAKRLLGAIRPADALGRYGGEEFMIVLGGCDNLEMGQVIAERVRQRVSACTVETEYGEVPVTISVGLAYHDRPAPTLAASLLRAADEALYQAKHSGRNLVVCRTLDPSHADASRRAA